MSRSVDYYRAVIIGDYELGEEDEVTEPVEDEGEAFEKAAFAVQNLKLKNLSNQVVIQRSTNGPDGPWLRY